MYYNKNIYITSHYGNSYYDIYSLIGLILWVKRSSLKGGVFGQFRWDAGPNSILDSFFNSKIEHPYASYLSGMLLVTRQISRGFKSKFVSFQMIQIDWRIFFQMGENQQPPR